MRISPRSAEGRHATAFDVASPASGRRRTRLRVAARSRMFAGWLDSAAAADAFGRRGPSAGVPAADVEERGLFASASEAYNPPIVEVWRRKTAVALSDTLKAIAERSQADADFETRKPDMIARWVKSIENLYERIESWLAPHIASHVIRIEVSETELNEELFGRYAAPTLTIRAGSYVVLVQPIARTIIGGLGRVDMFRQGRSARDERVLLLRGTDEERSDWLVRRPLREAAKPRRVEPLTKERFEAALDELLT